MSQPRLDSQGRDFRYDPSAGSPGPSNGQVLALAVAGVALFVFLFHS
jgi:hypothetical protein